MTSALSSLPSSPIPLYSHWLPFCSLRTLSPPAGLCLPPALYTAVRSSSLSSDITSLKGFPCLVHLNKLLQGNPSSLISFLQYPSQEMFILFVCISLHSFILIVHLSCDPLSCLGLEMWCELDKVLFVPWSLQSNGEDRQGDK